MKAKLSFSESSVGPLFKLALEPFQIEQSCRFQRAFGGDRFLYLLTPNLEKFPNHLIGQNQNLKFDWRLMV
jgi:hypothetical protein